MYRYDEFDHTLVTERVHQFRDQVERRLSGELTEDQFKPLRLMNGLYLQLHAYMLRVAVPYGTLSSTQMRKLAYIARRYDKGYGHFTTRQNIQFNWPKLEETPDILAELAEVEMHAIQTSGNCIRNTTSDQFAGAAADEIEDPRVYCEIIRQWSTLHPEFTFLPRKFKIAVTGADHDRAAVRVHDIGLQMRRNEAGEVGFEVIVGGGLGRTPVIGQTIREFLPKQHLLSYLEAILRVYNQLGRRDNLYKARIKILVRSEGIENFARLVEEEWSHIKDSALQLPEDEITRIETYFAPPRYERLEDTVREFEVKRFEDRDFASWVRTNVTAHKEPGYAVATISLKPTGKPPGDASAWQMDAVADLAESYSFSEIRVTHEQNLVLPNVRKADLYALWQSLRDVELATPNAGLLSDMIACPGLDYCNLANARSIPVAQRISERFSDLERQHDIGSLKIKISGCINACGHHHVGHIGLLGVDKKGEEFYQITLGGSADENTAIGKIVGPAFSYDDVVDAVEKIVDTYLNIRSEDEEFSDTFRRVGLTPFKETLYAAH
ncbi:nitrite/sulfite reductase [Denitrobaculum tricleocarpae]|uniref:Nitrite/sulfite reductase n=1 Tax=Denitrobaculum tricleocarpae TaxID=2591009 RepID=A0A545TXK0_9PROT|nr:nitrite/sulfite reductase [Denitrobaculum tricleocarpae]TQV81937.1 nitrite/sulfite reductase [Denitrobaculum tricleocarpae]